jgi:hypothetical protein
MRKASGQVLCCCRCASHNTLQCINDSPETRAVTDKVVRMHHHHSRCLLCLVFPAGSTRPTWVPAASLARCWTTVRCRSCHIQLPHVHCLGAWAGRCGPGPLLSRKTDCRLALSIAKPCISAPARLCLAATIPVGFWSVFLIYVHLLLPRLQASSATSTMPACRCLKRWSRRGLTLRPLRSGRWRCPGRRWGLRAGSGRMSCNSHGCACTAVWC